MVIMLLAFLIFLSCCKMVKLFTGGMSMWLVCARVSFFEIVNRPASSAVAFYRLYINVRGTCHYVSSYTNTMFPFILFLFISIAKHKSYLSFRYKNKILFFLGK